MIDFQRKQRLAHEAGLEGLFAEIRKGNTRSQAVLRRVGFQLSEQKPTRGDDYMVFPSALMPP